MQAIHGVGIDWTFAGEAVEYGGFLVRGTAVLVSLGGMLVTALMLGLVSGESPSPRCCSELYRYMSLQCRKLRHHTVIDFQTRGYTLRGQRHPPRMISLPRLCVNPIS